MATSLEHNKQIVAYYYDESFGNFYYSPNHAMKPHRVRMAHNLICSLNLFRNLHIFRPYEASPQEMTQFHDKEYIDFLRNVTVDNQHSHFSSTSKFSLGGDDCPVFDGLFRYCQLSCGGSLAAATKLNKKEADITINWMGGLHHAKKGNASGFCYTNDIVLGILELLKHHKRVLYVDIDIHHGDGVEEAFYTTDRVMTVSFHKYGKYFPGTGGIGDTGHEKGKHFSVNVPLLDGITDQNYYHIFKTVMERVIERYDPEAIVLQCGADSLNGDKLGDFNLTVKGHSECVRFLRSQNRPLMLLGGGGYTPRNVARCWAYETAVALNTEVPETLPFTYYHEHYGPEYTLNTRASETKVDLNTRVYVNQQLEVVLQNLKEIIHAPSVQAQGIPRDHDADFVIQRNVEVDPDVRLPQADIDRGIQDNREYFD